MKVFNCPLLQEFMNFKMFNLIVLFVLTKCFVNLVIWVKAHFGGGHFGYFHNMYVKYISTKYIAFNFGFHFWCLGLKF
jgi:hypothetical protein